MTNINAVGPYYLAKNCNRHNTKLIHISTDYVFDGMSTTPYTEDSEPSPLNVYGESKLIGERLVQLVNESAIILRTSWVFANEGKCFPSKIVELAESKNMISVVNDQFGKPTFAGDIADAIMLILRTKSVAPGIYHFAGEPTTTWFEFAEFVVHKAFTERKINAMPKIVPIGSSDYPTAAKRPKYSVLDTTKIEKTLGIKGKCWKSFF